MIINYWLGLTLVVITWIALIVLSFRFLFPRMKRIPAKIRLVLCLAIPSIPAVPLLEVVLFPVIIIQADGTIHRSLLIGSTDYDTGDGKTARISFDYPYTTIVNQSEDNYVVETVVYTVSASESPDATGLVPVPAHSAAKSKTKLDFFPNEAPPDEMSFGQHDLRKKGWLRLANESDF